MTSPLFLKNRCRNDVVTSFRRHNYWSPRLYRKPMYVEDIWRWKFEIFKKKNSKINFSKILFLKFFVFYSKFFLLNFFIMLICLFLFNLKQKLKKIHAKFCSRHWWPLEVFTMIDFFTFFLEKSKSKWRFDVILTPWFKLLVATIIGHHDNAGNQSTLKTFWDEKIEIFKKFFILFSKNSFLFFSKKILFRILFVSKYWILKLSLTKSQNSYWIMIITHPIRIALRALPTLVSCIIVVTTINFFDLLSWKIVLMSFRRHDYWSPWLYRKPDYIEDIWR